MQCKFCKWFGTCFHKSFVTENKTFHNKILPPSFGIFLQSTFWSFFSILLFQLNQHFTGARGTSSRDERNLYTTEPINFPSETEGLVKKLTCIERSSDLRPVPISSSSENTSHAIGEELKDKVKYSVRDYNSQLPGKEVTAGSVNSYERSLKHTGTSESLL